MFLGLFESSMEAAIANGFNIPPNEVEEILDVIKPARQTISIASFLLSSIFVTWFALYKASCFRTNCALFALRICTLLLYTPILVFFNSYIDAVVVACSLLLRFAYLGYYSYKYKSFSFLVLNTSKIAFVNGKFWYYVEAPYVVLYGGDHHVQFGEYMIPFADSNELYVALRGTIEDDVPLSRKVEMMNGAFIYIFACEPCVGIVNMSFKETQLDEDLTSITLHNVDISQ